MKLVILVSTLFLVFTGCWSSQEVNVKAAWPSPDGTRIELWPDTCNADLSSRVEETEREVRVLVTARGSTSNDCADVHTIILSEPLGDRLLIDEFDGEAVDVSLNEDIPDPIGR